MQKITLFIWLLTVSVADKQLCFLHHCSHHALPSASLCQREESGNSHGLDHDDICRSVIVFLKNYFTLWILMSIHGIIENKDCLCFFIPSLTPDKLKCEACLFIRYCH